MSIPLGTPAFLALISCFAASATARAAQSPATRPSVVVELFTSEGCSSCPPADNVLARLAAQNAVDGVQIIPLAMHVDYWNYLGWTDRFSSPEFSERQQQYARYFNATEVYTPQMVVDGAAQFIGSDEQKAVAAIRQAAAVTKGTIAIDLTRMPDDARSLSCKISIGGISPSAWAASEITLALSEDGLSTSVPRGENAGTTLHHTAVVRSLQRVRADSNDDKQLTASAVIALQPNWRVDKLHVAVWVQDIKSGRVLACNQVSPR